MRTKIECSKYWCHYGTEKSLTQQSFRTAAESNRAVEPSDDPFTQAYAYRDQGQAEAAESYTAPDRTSQLKQAHTRKRPAGIIRKIDELGRVVIPQETRSMLGISIFDALEVYTDDETQEIMVKKYSPGCIHCNSFDGLISIKQKQICRSCLQQIIHEARTRNASFAEQTSVREDSEQE